MWCMNLAPIRRVNISVLLTRMITSCFEVIICFFLIPGCGIEAADNYKAQRGDTIQCDAFKVDRLPATPPERIYIEVYRKPYESYHSDNTEFLLMMY